MLGVWAQYREAESTVSSNTEALVSRLQEGTGSGEREGRGVGVRGHSASSAGGQRRGSWECVGNTWRQRKGAHREQARLDKGGWVRG